MTDYALTFTTELAPAKKFLVDGQEYSLLGVDHLSTEDENEVTALFARFGVLTDELSLTSNLDKGRALAEKVKSTRISILCKVTSLDKETAERLHPTQQTQIIEAIISEVEAGRVAED